MVTMLLLSQYTLGCGLATVLVKETMLASLSDLVHLEIRTRHGGLEAPFLEEPDIRLGTVTLVLLVVNELDSLQALKGSHDAGSHDEVIDSVGIVVSFVWGSEEYLG